MRRAIYPGSFNPFHKGHQDILNKARRVFDEITVAIFGAPEVIPVIDGLNVSVEFFDGMLVDYVENKGFCAVIRGIRNSNDLIYESQNQYWNEDLGLKIPIVYFLSDRSLTHISSTAYRSLKTKSYKG